MDSRPLCVVNGCNEPGTIPVRLRIGKDTSRGSEAATILICRTHAEQMNPIRVSDSQIEVREG